MTGRKPSPAAPAASRPRLRRLWRVAVVFCGGVLLVDAIAGERGLIELMRVRDEQRQLERELASARAEHARLKDDVQRLKTDSAAIEDVARRELGLIKPGEKLFVIRDVPPKP